MNTFLPYANFRLSLKCLDNKRLGKQRVEAFQILKAIYLDRYGWQQHPCKRMWMQYPDALTEYMNTAIDVWMERGFKNSMRKCHVMGVVYPSWLGLPKFHDSHKSNLLRKDSVHYGKYGWTVSDSLPYYWNDK